MRAVVMRVARARVAVAQRTTGEIGVGLLALVGVEIGDTGRDADWIAEKIAGLRIFPDDDGRMNRSVADARGEILLVSQFTLLGDARKGRRPSFVRAEGGDAARELFDRVGRALESTGVRAAYGEFGADMDVESINRGPVTIVLDSRRDL